MRNRSRFKQYVATFEGRIVGATGKQHHIATTVSGINKEDARLNLYLRYEHIQQLTLTLKS